LAKSNGRIRLGVKDIIGKRVLILGEVGSGKTLLASKLLKELMTIIDPREITIIDMAPRRIGKVGGKISDYVDSIDKARYLSPKKVYAPRLAGTSRQQVLEYAELNRRAVEPLLAEFSRSPTKVLILNDVTLYLHAGRLGRIIGCMRLAETFLATAYRGSRLAEDHGSGITNRERRLVEAMAIRMDRTIELERS